MRELSRKVRLAQVSVIFHLKALSKEGLINREKEGIYPFYRAHREAEDFKLLKKQNIQWRIYHSGLVEYLDQKLKPTSMVLFGSAARGEDTEESDLDLFIQAQETTLSLSKYEKLLHRKINILFEPDLGKLSKELLNNLINGVILYGYLKVL